MESKNPRIAKTKNARVTLLLKCAICDSKKSKFIKKQEASVLLNSLGVRTSRGQIPLVDPLFF